MKFDYQGGEELFRNSGLIISLSKLLEASKILLTNSDCL